MKEKFKILSIIDTPGENDDEDNYIVQFYLNKEYKKGFYLFLCKNNFVNEDIKKIFISNIEKYTNNILKLFNIMTEIFEDIYSREKIYNKGNPYSLENISSKIFIHIYPEKIFDLYNESLYKSLLFRINPRILTIPVLCHISCGKSSLLNLLMDEKQTLEQNEKKIIPVLGNTGCGKSSLLSLLMNTKLVQEQNEKKIKCNEENKIISLKQIDEEEHLYSTILEEIKICNREIDNQNFHTKDSEIIIDNKRDKNTYKDLLDYIEDKKTYKFGKKLKCLEHFNENRHFFCKKCYSFPKVELEFETNGKILVFCSCEPDKFDKENEKNKKIYEYIVNKYELINNEKENFITNSFLCNKHIKKYKYFCKICQKNLCRKCLQIEEAHNMHDLILFDFISDKIKEKIDYIKQVINSKPNIINNIYFNGNKIDIEELLNLIITDYSEYKNYNLIKSIENIYEFLFSKKQEILNNNCFSSLCEEKDHLSSLLEPLPKKEVVNNNVKIFYRSLSNNDYFINFRDVRDLFVFKVHNLFYFKVHNTKKEECQDDLCEKSTLLFLDGTNLYLLNSSNLERLLIKKCINYKKRTTT